MLVCELHCPHYYSDSGNKMEKMAILRDWLTEKTEMSCLLMMILIFRVKINYLLMQLMLHYRAPCSAIDFVQECGHNGHNSTETVLMMLLSVNSAVLITHILEVLPAMITAM